ncbi:O-antigen ligase family protein [Deinococcus indicus]|nr:O-antigen ligase family protein [Deinococcus indicus]
MIVKEGKALLIIMVSATISLLISCLIEGGSLVGAYIFITQILMARYLSLYSDRVVRSVLIILVAAIFLSALTAIYNPLVGTTIDNINQQWKGLLSHKNRLGGLAAFGLLASIMLHREALVVRFVLFAISAICLLESQSSGALIVSLSVIIIYMASLYLKRAVFNYFLLVSVVFTALSITVSDEILSTSLSYFGRDTTLTGRIPLWNEIFSNGYINLFGYGFNNFWNPQRQSFSLIASAIGWQPFYSHNGYIELMIVFGWPTALILVAFIMRAFTLSFVLNRHTSESMIILFFLLYNWSEASMSQYDSPLLILLFLFVFISRRNIKAHGLKYREATNVDK